jgi:hypothetical protein
MPMLYLVNGDTANRTRRPKVELPLTDEERSQLHSFARIILSSADGELNSAIADRLKLTKTTLHTKPMLPMGFGYVEGVTHDYKRHGITTLFAALSVLNGAVLAACKPRQRHQEFLLREIDEAVPAGRVGRSLHLRQPRHSQPPEGQGLAGHQAEMAQALHPDLQLVAKPSRAILRADHRHGHSPRILHKRQAARTAHRPLRRRAQRKLPAIQLDRHR